MRNLLFSLAASAVLALCTGCAGVQPKVAVDTAGADIGVHFDWKALAGSIGEIFTRDRDKYGLPDFTLPVLDAPVALGLGK